ncbi:hypothetical protein ABZN20_17320 [Methylococcus sp. ANG]|uniref:DUF6969 family protein n=1 Tax=Methylococcus sp. ANG TaxID=3231903 RepID=UPI003458FC07
MANTPNSLAVDTPDALPRFDPAGLDPARLETMAEAGARILECYRVLRKGGLNIVGEVLRDQGTFYELDHYPKDDVFDDESRCQYYYHAHRPDSGEHGHFHTFMRWWLAGRRIIPERPCTRTVPWTSRAICRSMSRHASGKSWRPWAIEPSPVRSRT